MIKDRKDFWSGAMFIAFGILFLIWSQEYTFGTASRMGPGYFPTMLAVLQIGLGALVVAPALRRGAAETHVDRIGWRGLLIVLGSVVLFGVALPHLGFIVSMILLLVISSLASQEFSLRETLTATVVLTVASYLVFVVGLEIQFPVWPTFLAD